MNNSLALLQSSVLTYMTTCAWYGTAEGKDQQDLYFEYILFQDACAGITRQVKLSDNGPADSTPWRSA